MLRYSCTLENTENTDMTSVTVHRRNGTSDTVTVAKDGSVSHAANGTERAVTGDDRPTTDPKTERVDVRLSPPDKRKFLALGGSTWLRKMLKRHGGGG